MAKLGGDSPGIRLAHGAFSIVGCCLVIGAVLGAAAAGSGEAPSTPAAPRAAKAYAVLDAHCARCHQTGRRDGTAVGGRLDHILDFARLARDRARVVPGLPDASRLYHVMLERHWPLLAAPGADVGTPAAPSPAAAQEVRGPLLGALTRSDLEAVRDWLVSLEAAGKGTLECTTRQEALPARRLRRALETDLWTTDEATARRTRYLALLAPAGACKAQSSDRDIRAALIRGLAARGGAVAGPLLRDVEGTRGRVVAIDIARLGIDAAEWDHIADALVPEVLARRLAGATVMAKTASVRPLMAADLALEALTGDKPGRAARNAASPVDLVRAAHEAGEAQEVLARRLARVTGTSLVAAQRLRVGVIDRAAWNRLAATIDWSVPFGEEVPVVTVAATPSAPAAKAVSTDTATSGPLAGDPPPAIALWTDKTVYSPGEAVVIRAVADRACYLTVINVDGSGAATVVFPNAFQRHNLLAAGVPVELPGEAAHFVFRARDRGRETIVAICDPVASPPLAITPDYELQRFTVLGNWQAYVLAAFAGEPPVLIKRAPRRNRYVRYRRRWRLVREPPKPKLEPFRPAGRAAVAYEVR
ncbi:MAG: DUF4384 domain-containing protein [Hyphomicrobiaceae bacterium]